MLILSQSISYSILPWPRWFCPFWKSQKGLNYFWIQAMVGGGGRCHQQCLAWGVKNPRHASGHLQLTITVYLLFWLNKLSFYAVIQFYNLLEILLHQQTLFKWRTQEINNGLISCCCCVELWPNHIILEIKKTLRVWVITHAWPLYFFLSFINNNKSLNLFL